MGFMNVYSHWLSPLSFVLALQATTTTFYPSFRRFYRRYPYFRSYQNFNRGWPGTSSPGTVPSFEARNPLGACIVTLTGRGLRSTWQ